MELSSDPLIAQKQLRRSCTPEQASAAAQVRAVRKKLLKQKKIPDDWAAWLLLDDHMAQQASDWAAAQYVARRFKNYLEEGRILDLCCGMGMDALALAQEGFFVEAVDISDEALTCLTHNAASLGLSEQICAKQADVYGLDIPDSVVQIDPDRRAGGYRTRNLAKYAPDGDFLRALIERTAGGSMKLSPATDWTLLADWPVSFEYISRDFTCRQLRLWWGALSPEGRHQRATVLTGRPEAFCADTLEVTPDAEVRVGEPDRFLLEADPAVIAGGGVDTLAEILEYRRIASGLDWLFGDNAVQTPFGRCYEVLAEVSGRERDISKALGAFDVGQVMVKPKGLRLDTDRLQKRFSGGGANRFAVFWGKVGRKQRAFVARRLDQS